VTQNLVLLSPPKGGGGGVGGWGVGCFVREEGGKGVRQVSNAAPPCGEGVMRKEEVGAGGGGIC